jgi:hypothetical protein
MRPNFQPAGKAGRYRYLVGALTTVTLADPEPVLPLPAMVEVMLHLGRKYKYQTGTDYGTQAVSRTDLDPRIHASD